MDYPGEVGGIEIENLTIADLDLLEKIVQFMRLLVLLAAIALCCSAIAQSDALTKTPPSKTRAPADTKPSLKYFCSAGPDFRVSRTTRREGE